MAVKFKLYDAKAAIREANKLLDGLGYIRTGAAGGSIYYARMGAFHRKIRLSDHPHSFKPRGDIAVYIVFDGPTIWPDIHHRVQKAHKDYMADTTGKKVVQF